MPSCRKCSAAFPTLALIEGEVKNLGNRIYCLNCSPWGKHNTRNLEGAKDGRNRKRNREPPPKLKLRAVRYKGGSCMVCAYSRSLSALSFHHRDPAQKDLASFQSRSWETLRVELDKCDLLCLNCHSEEHERLPYYRRPATPTSTETKKCTKCLLDRPVSEFYVSGEKRKTECKPCFRDRMNARHAAHRMALVNQAGGGCKFCGYDRSFRVLSFHHLDPTEKEFKISRRLSAPLPELLIEAAKCVLLCPNCHAEEHDRLRLE